MSDLAAFFLDSFASILWLIVLFFTLFGLSRCGVDGRDRRG